MGTLGVSSLGSLNKSWCYVMGKCNVKKVILVESRTRKIIPLAG